LIWTQIILQPPKLNFRLNHSITRSSQRHDYCLLICADGWFSLWTILKKTGNLIDFPVDTDGFFRCFSFYTLVSSTMWRSDVWKRIRRVRFNDHWIRLFLLPHQQALTAAVVRRFFSKRFVQRVTAEIRRGAKLIWGRNRLQIAGRSVGIKYVLMPRPLRPNPLLKFLRPTSAGGGLKSSAPQS